MPRTGDTTVGREGRNRTLPDPFEGVREPGLTFKELDGKRLKLNEARRSVLLEREDELLRLVEMHKSADDMALSAVTSLNKKWGTKFRLQLPWVEVG